MCVDHNFCGLFCSRRFVHLDWDQKSCQIWFRNHWPHTIGLSYLVLNHDNHQGQTQKMASMIFVICKSFLMKLHILAGKYQDRNLHLGQIRLY